jgi:HPr kinase/phosphorylase
MNVPVLFTEFPTTRFVSMLTHIITQAHAPMTSMHGTLVDVFGIGMLLLGKSGVGKSETALELVERGHRLVADDLVEVKKVDDFMIMGSGSNLIRHHIEIRGLGILNIKDIYGIRSVRNRKRIELVASLEDWDETKVYDRLGIDEKTYALLRSAAYSGTGPSGKKYSRDCRNGGAQSQIEEDGSEYRKRAGPEITGMDEIRKCLKKK